MFIIYLILLAIGFALRLVKIFLTPTAPGSVGCRGATTMLLPQKVNILEPYVEIGFIISSTNPTEDILDILATLVIPVILVILVLQEIVPYHQMQEISLFPKSNQMKPSA